MIDANEPTPSPATQAGPEPRSYWIESLNAGAQFMATASMHPLTECLEPLVSISDAAAEEDVPIVCLGTPHPAGDRIRDHRIRAGNVQPLLNVARALDAQGLTLVIEDALRTPQTQRASAGSGLALRAYGEMLAWVDPDASDKQIVERLAVICAATPITAGHIAGAAVDVSVRRADGSELDRGGPYLDLSQRMPMASPFIGAEQAAARALITDAMASQGFVAYPFEFWHYSRGDVLAAVASGSSEPAIYGPVHVAADGAVSPVENVQEPLANRIELVGAVRAAIATASRLH